MVFGDIILFIYGPRMKGPRMKGPSKILIPKLIQK